MESAVPGTKVAWGDEGLDLRVEVGPSGVARLAYLAGASAGLGGEARLSGAGADQRGNELSGGLHLVDVVTAGTGRAWSGRRYAESVTGGRLRYVGHEERSAGPWHDLVFELEDPASQLCATVTYRVLVGRGVLRSSVRLINRGTSPVTVESVTSFLGTGLAGPTGHLADVDIWWADNEWLGEDRWHARPFRDALPDLRGAAHQADQRGMFGLTSEGSWSSGGHLPMGAALNRRTRHAWVWQVEHNGAWHWQVGERARRRRATGQDDRRDNVDSDEAGSEGVGDDAYLALLGPTDAEHQWRLVLGPGESFETVPVAVALSAAGLEEALAGLTHYRRAIRRPHEDHRRLPVIFNDYMNTLMGDPTTERLMPLIRAAAGVGAEYFCIDSGWYAELGETWWDTVGAWAPSRSRFSGGLGEVIEAIRSAGMVPGLWLEPEVVGVRSPIADTLPAEAYFCRGGERVVEQGRYQLDFSHPAARAHLDRVVDFLVGEFGVGYLKMDYNINIGPGTERDGSSPGAGLLAHNRAFLDWADGLLERHEGLTIESCASGGMRMDYALLSRFQLQSTSDQQDFLRYPPIAAAVPMAVAPEQAAVWAYPQPGWSNNEIAFTLCSALLGRVHLSGHLDKMSESEQQLVAEAINVYKRVRGDLAGAVPFWPLGLPRWEDHWFAVGMRATEATYLSVWHRGALEGREEETGTVSLPVGLLGEDNVTPVVLYPTSGSARLDWRPDEARLLVTLPEVPSACLVAFARQDP